MIMSPWHLLEPCRRIGTRTAVTLWHPGVRRLADMSQQSNLSLPSIPSAIRLPSLTAPKASNHQPTSSDASPATSIQDMTLNYTQDPLIHQVVNNIMKHGKKSLAQRLVSDALLYIQKVNHPHQHENPRKLLAQAVDMAAPLVKIASQKRGSKTIHSPRPITEHVRRRTGILWIVQAAKARGKGKPFPVRFGNEILAVLSGESAALQKKLNLHRMALANRSNVIMNDRKL